MEKKLKRVEKGLGKELFMEYNVWLFLMLIIILVGVVSPQFLNRTNVMNMLREAVVIGILGIGMTFVIICGCFDLSSGAIMGFCAVVCMTIGPSTSKNTFLAIAVPMGIGLLFGMLDGILMGYLKMSAFITTLGMQYVFLGITLLFTEGSYVYVKKYTSFFYEIGNGYLGEIPIAVVLMIVLAGAAQFVLSKTTVGQNMKASGANENAAALSGIRVERNRCISYMVLGLCAAVAGIVLASWVRQMEPRTGVNYAFEAITAVVLGGTSLQGGRGNVFNSIAGTLVMVMIVNAMILLNISYNYQLMVRGIILIAAVTLDVMMRRRRG